MPAMASTQDMRQTEGAVSTKASKPSSTISSTSSSPSHAVPLPMNYSHVPVPVMPTVYAYPSGIPPSRPMSASLATDPEMLQRAIQSQVEYYFSPQNLSRDEFLTSKMDSDKYVAITTISEFKKIKALTSDLDLVTQALQRSSLLQVDETHTKVRAAEDPSFSGKTNERTTLILRDIPSSASTAEIREIFTSLDSAIVSIRSEIQNTWFVKFQDEETCMQAALLTKSKSFQGSSIRSCVKSETTTTRSYYQPPPARMMPMYGPPHAPMYIPTQYWDPSLVPMVPAFDYGNTSASPSMPRHPSHPSAHEKRKQRQSNGSSPSKEGNETSSSNYTGRYHHAKHKKNRNKKRNEEVGGKKGGRNGANSTSSTNVVQPQLGLDDFPALPNARELKIKERRTGVYEREELASIVKKAAAIEIQQQQQQQVNVVEKREGEEEEQVEEAVQERNEEQEEQEQEIREEEEGSEEHVVISKKEEKNDIIEQPVKEEEEDDDDKEDMGKENHQPETPSLNMEEPNEKAISMQVEKPISYAEMARRSRAAALEKEKADRND